MLKATLSNGDLVIGISTRNVELLQARKPVIINKRDFGKVEGNIIIVYGDSLTEIFNELRKIGFNVPGG